MATFLYEDRFCTWNFHRTNLTEAVLDNWLNLSLIKKECRGIDVSEDDEMEDIMFGMKDLVIIEEDIDIEIEI